LGEMTIGQQFAICFLGLAILRMLVSALGRL
jgi:hypothetical protein